MQSKIKVDLKDGLKPCITIERVMSDHLADKVLQLFFEELNYESNFLGIINNGNNSDIVPLSIPHLMEWFFRWFEDNRNIDPVYLEETYKKLVEIYNSPN